MTDYFFADPAVDLDLLLDSKFLKKLSESELAALLDTTLSALRALPDWQADALQTTLNSLLETTGKKPAELFSLIRLAVSFAPFSPALNLTLAVLGRDRTLARLAAVKSALINDGE